VLSYAKRHIDTPECKEKLPNMVMKIGNQVYSLTRLFSLWTKSIGLNVRAVSFPIIPWFAVITSYQSPAPFKHELGGGVSSIFFDFECDQ
jgi:hypothetical protein